MAITSFADARTLALFEGERVKRVASDLGKRAQAKLDALDQATNLSELASPGADLKKLKGARNTWQMRVNRQFRIRFRVLTDEPLEVADVWFGDPH